MPLTEVQSDSRDNELRKIYYGVSRISVNDHRCILNIEVLAPRFVLQPTMQFLSFGRVGRRPPVDFAGGIERNIATQVPQ